MDQPLLDVDPPSLRELAFAVVDLETSGGCPLERRDREGHIRPAAEITEVGLVEMDGREIRGRFGSLCAIERDIPDAIRRLTGITPDLLAGAPTWEQVALALAPRLRGRIWVAHSAVFDGAFLKATLPEGLWRAHRLICTVKLAKRFIPEAPSKSLVNLVAFLGLHNAQPHRALADAEATASLLQVLIDRAEAEGLDGEAFLEAGEVGWATL